MLLYMVALILYFMFLVISVFTLTEKYQRETEIDHQRETITNVLTYTARIEEMVDGMKKFKHDHKNLLLGFNEHLKNKEIEKAQRYYEEYMACFVESTTATETSLNDLARIKIPELKSVLMFKFLRAMQQGIAVYVEIRKPIDNIVPNNILDLCRIVGILIDNAIEASLGTGKPLVKFIAYADKTMVTLVFSNTCAVDSPPPLDKLFDSGFSTKGEGRGRGLHTVLEIMNESDIFSLGTGIKDGFFEQELNIIP